MCIYIYICSIHIDTYVIVCVVTCISFYKRIDMSILIIHVKDYMHICFTHAAS